MQNNNSDSQVCSGNHRHSSFPSNYFHYATFFYSAEQNFKSFLKGPSKILRKLGWNVGPSYFPSLSHLDHLQFSPFFLPVYIGNVKYGNRTAYFRHGTFQTREKGKLLQTLSLQRHVNAEKSNPAHTAEFLSCGSKIGNSSCLPLQQPLKEDTQGDTFLFANSFSPPWALMCF